MAEFSTIATIFIKVLKLVSSIKIHSYSACIWSILGIINVHEIKRLADLLLGSSVTEMSLTALQKHVILGLASFIMWRARTVVPTALCVSYELLRVCIHHILTRRPNHGG
jgi:hypothetical protein